MEVFQTHAVQRNYWTRKRNQTKTLRLLVHDPNWKIAFRISVVFWIRLILRTHYFVKQHLNTNQKNNSNPTFCAKMDNFTTACSREKLRLDRHQNKLKLFETFCAHHHFRFCCTKQKAKFTVVRFLLCACSSATKGLFVSAKFCCNQSATNSGQQTLRRHTVCG